MDSIVKSLMEKYKNRATLGKEKYGTDDFNRFKAMDSIVKSLMDKYKNRATLGKEKYGTDMDREDLSIIDWLRHAQEESMDYSIYLEKLIQEYEKSNLIK